MVSRPAAVPRANAVRADATPHGEDKPNISEVVGPSVLAPSPKTASDDSSSLDFSDFVFSESSPDFQVESDIDPIDAEAEEAAILFANGQDDVVRTVLENAVHVHHFGPGERLWLMLFDLYRLLGKKTAFEEMGIDYAQAFEKSPPGWSGHASNGEKTIEIAAGSLLFRGDLTGDNHVAFDTVKQALEKNPRLRLDLSKVNHLDSEGCRRLLGLLQQARKARREIELLGRNILEAQVLVRVENGRAENEGCWLLFLELCQLQGKYEIFEDTAVNYAVTFEVSPPSWEPKRVAAPEPMLQTSIAANDVATDAYVLRGDIKASRFGDLPAYAEVHDPVLIDCAGLARIDFISAGALLNLLTTIRRTGKQIVFRYPNYLVAELFGVVGLRAVATIVFAKY